MKCSHQSIAVPVLWGIDRGLPLQGFLLLVICMLGTRISREFSPIDDPLFFIFLCFQDSQCGTVIDVNIECAVKLVGTNCILYPVNSKDLQHIWVRYCSLPLDASPASENDSQGQHLYSGQTVIFGGCWTSVFPCLPKSYQKHPC